MSKPILVLSLLAGCADDPVSITAHVRVANLSTELATVDLCVDHQPIAHAVAYGSMTRYLDVSVPPHGEIDVGCDAPVGSHAYDALPDGPLTLVVLGRPSDPQHPVTVAVLPDEDFAPKDPTRAKLRGFATDVEGPTIDVGFPMMDGTHVLVFSNFSYGATPRTSSLGPISDRGYLDGVPVPYPAPRLFIWPSGGETPLGYFPGADVPFAAGHTYDVFAAGRVFTGTAEAFVCDDTAEPATAADPLTPCTQYTALHD